MTANTDPDRRADGDAFPQRGPMAPSAQVRPQCPSGHRPGARGTMDAHRGLRCLLLLPLVSTLLWAAPAGAQRVDDLTEMSLEELMGLEVVSVSKKAERVSETAAAVFVITQDDIRRLGFTSIPEALRIVPGLQVCRLDSNKWAVTARGFNGRFANKLLVLVDGQSVYTPLYSGVFWETLDVLMDDIDRIEVVRGPGAAIWGANAVNGVINVITKSASDTQGGLLTLGAGNEERGFTGLRYGGTLGDRTYYRTYAKYFDRDSFRDASGSATADRWEIFRGGVRLDHESSGGNTFSLQANAFNGDIGETVTLASLTPPYMQMVEDAAEMVGASVLGRWKRAISDVSNVAIQLNYDRLKRREAITRFISDIFGADFQHRFSLGHRHDFVWGLGYRLTDLDLEDTFTVSFRAERSEDRLLSAFVHYDFALVPSQLQLTTGSKFEHSSITGHEVQPNARLLWIPTPRHRFWVAASRAARTPTIGEHYAQFVGQVYPPDKLVPGAPALVAMSGSSDFESEELVAYELGYRSQPRPWLSLDATTFCNVYHNLRSLEPGTPVFESSPPPLHLLIPLSTQNKMNGKTYGFELLTDWQASDAWRLQASYTYLQMDLYPDEDSGDQMSEQAEGASPHHQFFVRSMLAVTRNVTFDVGARYVDELPDLGVNRYSTMDLRLGWTPVENLEVSIVGRNLLDDRHPEITPEFYDTLPTEVERGVFGKITWHF